MQRRQFRTNPAPVRAHCKVGTWTSHFSTAPSESDGLTRVRSGTTSPSRDTMPTMSPLPRNCTASMPAAACWPERERAAECRICCSGRGRVARRAALEGIGGMRLRNTASRLRPRLFSPLGVRVSDGRDPEHVTRAARRGGASSTTGPGRALKALLEVRLPALRVLGLRQDLQHLIVRQEEEPAARVRARPSPHLSITRWHISLEPSTTSGKARCGAGAIDAAAAPPTWRSRRAW